MNFTGINLDLQGVMKRTYANILYQSTFWNFLDETQVQYVRQSGTPIIEVIKQTAIPTNKRDTVEIESPLSPTLATYQSVKVDLTELRLDYSFKISPIMIGTNIAGAIQGQIDLQDSQNAQTIDVYGYGKLNKAIVGPQDGSMAYVNGQISKWAPSSGQECIEAINQLKADLFNRNISYGYICGLGANTYAYLVSALTSVLKYETRAGVEGVDMGIVANAYGVSFFQVNDNVLAGGELGYFGSTVATVGDMFFSALAEYTGNYPGLPGYYVLEGNLFFGADVVRPEALIKLVDSIPTVTAGSFDDGTTNSAYSQTTAFSGTDVVSFTASGLPTGLSLNETTGELTGTPTTAGTYTVNVYGIDASGNYSNAYTGTITIS